MPNWLKLLLTPLPVVAEAFPEAKPFVDAVVALAKDMFPEHATRIEDILPAQLATDIEQEKIDTAIAKASKP